MLLTVTTLHTYYPAAFWICLGLTLILAGAGIAGAITFQKHGAFSAYDAVVASILWCYAVAVLYFTVIGRYAHPEYRTELTLFDCYRKLFRDGDIGKLKNILVNLAMLAPVAFLFAELRRNKRRRVIPALMVSVGFSLLIECLQYVSRTGTFEIDDIFNNLVGAIATAVIWKAWDLIRNSIIKRRNSNE